MFSQKRLSAKELFQSIRIERLKAEHRMEKNIELIKNYQKELKGEKAEDKISE